MFSLYVGIFHGILWVPKNVVMDLNNVMSIINLILREPIYLAKESTDLHF